MKKATFVSQEIIQTLHFSKQQKVFHLFFTIIFSSTMQVNFEFINNNFFFWANTFAIKIF